MTRSSGRDIRHTRRATVTKARFTTLASRAYLMSLYRKKREVNTVCRGGLGSGRGIGIDRAMSLV